MKNFTHFNHVLYIFYIIVSLIHVFSYGLICAWILYICLKETDITVFLIHFAITDFVNFRVYFTNQFLNVFVKLSDLP